ncbi:MAG: hypothetical protein JSR45_17570 [Proteobacteria bacterium]|nr:hypothetical protein [Pseudomonadota bacterium]
MTKSTAKRDRAQTIVAIGAKLSRAGLMLGTALGCSIAVVTTFKPTPVLAADVTCTPDASGTTTSGPELCQNSGDKITYTANGDLTVALDNVVTNTGGVQIDASGGKYAVGVYDLNKAGFLYSNATDGLSIKSKGGAISVDTTLQGTAPVGSGTFILGAKTGINADNYVAGGGKIDLNLGAYVSSKGTGVLAHSYGAINITTQGGNAGGSAMVVHSSDGDIYVHQTSGSLRGDFYNTGAGNGLKTQGDFNGSTHVVTDAGTRIYGGNGSAGAEGVHVTTNQGAVTLDLNGTVQDGVYARTKGAANGGTVNLGANVYNTGGVGVSLQASGGQAYVHQTAGAISASAQGINVVGNTGGIYVHTESGTTISSTNTGIVANASGSTGAVTVYAIGNVKSTSGDGIYAASSGGQINIITAGAIIKGDPGIKASNTGSGGVYEHIQGNVYATKDAVQVSAESGYVNIQVKNGAHLYAQNAGAGGHGINTTVTDGNINIVGGLSSAITADSDGIHAYATKATAAGDAIFVNWAGSINSGGTGMYARANNGVVTLTGGATVTAGTYGVVAQTDNGGNITVYTHDVTASKGIGVVAHAYGDGNINVGTSTIKGQYGGVDAYTTKGTIEVSTGAITTYAKGTEGGDGVHAVSGAGQVNVYVHGDVNAYGRGIVAVTGDASSVYVQADGVVTAGKGMGIIAQSHDGAVEVKAGGLVTGATNGLYATSGAAGRVYVLTSNGVTANGGDAIRAKSKGGDIIVGYADGGSVLSGAISATKDGVHAYTYGKGRVLVAGDSTATIDAGRYGVYTHAEDGLTSIFMQGDITAKYTGVVAYATGTGEVDVSVANVTGKQGAGVFVSGQGGPLFLQSTGTVQGAGNGAYLYAHKGGNIDVEAANLYGGDGDGVFAKVKGDGSITIKAGVIGGGTYGAYSKVSGQGSIYLNASGAVSGTSGSGVFARLSDATNTGDITVITGGKASGGFYGVYASNQGTGHISITTGGAYGQTKAGIAAFATSGYVYVHSTGAVTGATYGITANGYGSASVSVHADSDVTGTSYAGVRALSNNGGDVYVGVGGTAKGGTHGVLATTNGAKAVTVNVTGDAYGASGAGVSATSAGGDVQVYVGGAAHGGTAGVYAATNGATAGGVSVTVKGDANGYGDAGVDALVQSTSASGDVKVSVGGSVYGATRGVFAYNAGTGGVDVGVTGHVYSNGGEGVRAVVGNAAATGDVKVNVGSYVTAHGGAGVYADNRGSGGVSVSTGAVSSDTTNGIYARTVSGGVYIHATGLVQTSAGATAIVGNVNVGKGDVTIHADGGAYSQGSDAIDALAHGGKITITAGDAVHGANYGIAAFNDTGGNISITASGSVTGDTQMGVQASAKGGGNVYVSVSGPVKAGTTGVHAVADGAGYVTVYAKGGVTTKNGAGVDAQTVNGAITVNTYGGKLIAKGGDGIHATSSGSGSISITTDYVRATSGRGIYATTATGGITVNSSGFVWGYGRGVDVKTSGSGDISVTTSGGVRSDHGYGIRAYSKGGAVKVYTGYVGAYSTGIVAISDSATADVKVVASSQVNSTKSRGILAYNLNSGATGQVYVNVADSITTAGGGVVANNAGTGSVYVGTRGVSAKYGDGINAIGGGDVYVHNTYGSNIHAGGDGVFAQSTGAGTVTVYAGGDTTSKYGRGVYAGSKGGNVGVTVYGDASGLGDAIEVLTSGKGYGGVYVAGKVTSASGNGISVTAGSGGAYVSAPGKIYAYGGDGVHAVSTGKTGAYVGGVSATGAGVYVSGGKFVRAVGGLNGGDIVAGGNGIEVITTGASKAYIASLGYVHSTGGKYALHASSQGGYTQIRTYGDVTADVGDGIVATSTGKGDVRVATYNGFLGGKAATITAAGDGIRVTSDTGNLDVLSYAAIVADPGIVMKTGGAGTVIVDSFGAITAKNGGIVTSTVDGYNHVYVYGTVEGDSDNNGTGRGVDARSYGKGDIVIHSYVGGDVVGHNAAGLIATAYGSGAVSIIQEGAVNADGLGVGARSFGGAVYVKSSGDITVSNSSNGLMAMNYGAGSTGAVTVIASGAIDSQGGNGIVAETAGTGAVTVTETGTISGNVATAIMVVGQGDLTVHQNGTIGSKGNAAGNGVYAYSSATGTGKISIDGSGNIYSDTNVVGILVKNSGTGAVSINESGYITGQNGVRVLQLGGGAVDVTTGGVVKTTDTGVFVSSSNGAATGAINITTNALVDAAGASGIYALSAHSGAITVTENGGISGRATGAAIFVEQSAGASGDLTVHMNGDVGSAGDYVGGAGAIAQILGGGSGSVTIDGKGAVFSAGQGVGAATNGSGDVTINLGGAVIANGGPGVYAGISGYASKGKISVTTAAVTASNYGVLAQNTGGGSGEVYVHTLGDIAAGSTGVLADTNGTGGVNVVIGGAIKAVGDGVYAHNGYSGDVSVDVTGPIKAGLSGVTALASNGGVYVTTHSTVTAGGTGIVARNYNSLSAAPVIVTSGGQIDAGGRGVLATSGGLGAVTVYENGGITGKASSDGVSASSLLGAVTVHVNGDIGSKGDGVGGYGVIASGGGLGAVRIDGAGAVYADGVGLQAVNTGKGSATVDTTGAIAAGGRGVYAHGSGGGSVTVKVAGPVTSGGTGVSAVQSGSGSGAVSVTTGGVIDAGGYGIRAVTNADGGLTVTQNAAITGKATGYGIFAGSYSATGGNVIVNANAAIGSSGDHVGGVGLFALSGGPGYITVNAQAIYADGTGVRTRQVGSGDTFVHVYGPIVSGDTGKGGAGVDTSATSGLTSIQVYADITAANNGIVASSTSGNITVYTQGGHKIAATAGDGIYASSKSGAINVFSNAAISADPGIHLVTGGVGVINVYSSGAISAKNGGIVTQTQNGANTVRVYNTVEGDSDNDGKGNGVQAYSTGSGAVTVHTFKGGDIVGHNYSGIVARGAGATSGVTVQNDGNVGTAGLYTTNGGVVAIISGNGSGAIKVTGSGLVYGGSVGIYANSNSTGSITINETGDIHSKATGVFAQRGAAGGAGDISITTDKVQAGATGIAAFQVGGGSGKIGVYANGPINAGSGSGVYAKSNASGDITIKTAKAVSSTGLYGVYALDSGAGNISITTSDTVSGKRDAIRGKINNAASTGSITVNAYGTLSSVQEWGVQAFNYGKGDIIVTTASTANILGSSYGGVVGIGNGAITVHLNGDVGSKADGVTGDGIYTHALSGSKTITIDGSGKIYSNHTGIFAEHDGAGGSIYVNHQTAAATIVAGANGIQALAKGAGSGTITVKNAASITAGGSAIYARMTSGGATGAISVTNSGLLDAVFTGIYARNDGTGGVTVTDTGGITGKAGNGIVVHGAGGNLIVHNNADIGSKAAAVANFGVYVHDTAGSGTVTIDGTGKVYAGGTGLYGRHDGAGGSVYINHQTASATINAGSRGIYGRTTGSGAGTITISNAAAITALTGIQAYASNAGATGLIKITNSGLIDAVASGIYAANAGSGGIRIVESGGITGKSALGVVATESGSGGDVYVRANAAIGSTGDHVSQFGILARNTKGGTGAVRVYAQGVYADGSGIVTAQSGSGYSGVRAYGNIVAGDTGKGGAGINASSASGYTRVATYGNITAANNGIVVTSTTGDIGVYTQSGHLIAATAGDGIYAASNSGSIRVYSYANITADPGINLKTGGAGVINVGSYGTISAKNGGIVTETQNGYNTVRVFNTVEGDSDNNNVGDGVHAHVTGTGALLVHTYAGGDIVGNNVVGIYAVNDGKSGNVQVIADGNIGTKALAVDGSGINAWVNSGGSGNVQVTGAGNIYAASRGIYAFSNGKGSITVNTTGNITSKLGDGVFARANGASSGVSVTTTGTITAAGVGIYAGENNAAATGAITVKASGLIDAAAAGIRTTNAGAGGTTVTDTGGITGKASGGIFALGAGGNVTIHNNADIGSKADSVTTYGVYAHDTAGSGTVTVDGTGRIYAGTVGIFARHDGTGGSVYVNHQTAAATINAGGRGIDARTYGSGASAITIKNAAGINATPDGIYAHMFNAGATGAITITNSGFIHNNGGTGIYANNAGTGGVVITDTGGVSGDAANGIVAFGAGGNVTVHNNADIGTSGNTVAGAGVYARDFAGSSTVTVDGTGKIYAGGTGVSALHDGVGGSVYVNHQTAAATITAGSRGIYARTTNSGAGTITVKNTAAINSGSDGVLAFASNAGNTGLVSVTNSGAIDAFGRGLVADSFGSGGVIVTDTGGVSGDATWGIVAQAYGGGTSTVHHNAAIGSSSNSVTFDGVYASVGAGSGAVTVDGSGVVWAGRWGIYAFNGSGTNNSNVLVTNTAAVHGGVDGVRVRGAGKGASALTVNNSAKVYGGSGDGISVIQSNAANTGAVTITSSAAVVGGKAGVRMGNAGSGGATFNNNNTTVYGAKYGVFSNTATTTVINNNTSSVISGKGGFAIDVTGGATTINNQGGSRIFGYAQLAGGNDILNNNLNGKWYAYGTTAFAGGTDTVNNGGTIFVAPFNGAATTVNWTGLEVFNNQGGIIDLRQTVGHTGDVFNLGAAAFTGTTVGTNDSRLFVDVNLSAALATDEIVIGSAAGNTSVVIRDVNPTAVGAINLTGVTVVDATSGTGAEFHMVPAVVDKGFVQYELRYFSAVSNWNIVGLPSAEGFEMLKSVEAGQDFWRHTADVWTARRQEARDANWGHEQRSEGWEMWAQAHAGGQQSDRTQSFVVGPFTLTHNLSVDSDWRGFQMGGDHHGAGKWDWGFTGGFMQQESRLHADGNSFDLEGWNVGAWTGFTSGSFFANGLVKGDWFNLDANMHTVPAMGHFDGHSWGVKGEAGWRMGSSSFYFEPVADVDWISTHLDSVDFGAAGASFTFKDATSAKGSIGARLGGQWGSLIPYVGLSWVDEFQRSNGMTMITGGGCPAACVTLNDTRPAAYGKADFGFTVKSWGGLEGFLKGEELFSGDYSGFTGRLGVRWRW